ncbi:MAG: uridine kinase [Bacteroidetes bacterium]|nr:uridine kinase [Bacteroidota bacterium]
MPKPYLIGISGGSASGKTTLLHILQQHFGPEQATLVSLDNYYKDMAAYEKVNDRGLQNFDHPEALQFGLFEEHLHRLLAGEAVQIREYHFNNPATAPRMITYRPTPLIIVEGILVFHHPAVRRLLDLRVFVDAPEHVRLARRIRRDLEERGFTLEDILDQYLSNVVPMYRKYVAPHKADCDLILPSKDRLEQAAQVLVHHLQAIVARQ